VISKIKTHKVAGAEIRALIYNADEMLDSKVKNFTTSAYVPVPKQWRGHRVKVIRLKKG
jgi:putative transposon-encoded protein